MSGEAPDLFTWNARSRRLSRARATGEVGRKPSEIPPIVRETFERLAIQLKAKGFARYSSDAILHQVRWHHQVERGDRDFSVNNDWSAPLARWLMDRHPQMAGFFELRQRKGERDEHRSEGHG